MVSTASRKAQRQMTEMLKKRSGAARADRLESVAALGSRPFDSVTEGLAGTPARSRRGRRVPLTPIAMDL